VGYLGFVFEIYNDELHEQYGKEVIVFVDLSSFSKFYAIGMNRFFPKSVPEFLITREMVLVPWESSELGMHYGRIALSKQTSIDFTHNTFWLSAKIYKEARSLLTISSLRYEFTQELLMRSSELLNLFLSKRKS
jgi:hypothetical protein